ncbi:MAG: hypothetical protein ABJ059_16385, partial [Hyphomicrobiales bacterium]
RSVDAWPTLRTQGREMKHTEELYQAVPITHECPGADPGEVLIQYVWSELQVGRLFGYVGSGFD